MTAIGHDWMYPDATYPRLCLRCGLKEDDGRMPMQSQGCMPFAARIERGSITCDGDIMCQKAANEIERLREGLKIIADTPDNAADMNCVVAKRYLEGGRWES